MVATPPAPVDPLELNTQTFTTGVSRRSRRNCNPAESPSFPGLQRSPLWIHLFFIRLGYLPDPLHCSAGFRDWFPHRAPRFRRRFGSRLRWRLGGPRLWLRFFLLVRGEWIIIHPLLLELEFGFGLRLWDGLLRRSVLLAIIGLSLDITFLGFRSLKVREEPVFKTLLGGYQKPQQ